jgi:uncharacterized membrane protein YjgN (DUF898 family)
MAAKTVDQPQTQKSAHCCKEATFTIRPCPWHENHGRVRARVSWEPEMDTPPQIATGPAPEKLNFSYVKRPGLFKLTIINFLLGIVTLGFYRFWAKTNVRKHIWSSVHINGEPLEYTGTGMELFKGFLVVFCIFVLPLVIIGTVLGVLGEEYAIFYALFQMAFLLAIYVLWGFAIYKARKYQLSRTNWRGIRGTLVGSAMTYSLLYFGSLLAKSMSFGWATPVMNTVLQEQITNDMRFGDAAFKFKGRAGPLYPTYALCWLLTLGAILFFTIGVGVTSGLFDQIKTFFESLETGADPETIVGLLVILFLVLFLLSALFIPMLWAVYVAKELRTFADYTRFDGVPFRMDVSAWSVIRLAVVNVLLIILTLGIAWPFVQQRIFKFAIDRLKLEGLIDIDRIKQSTVAKESRGEGLADAFDIGGI